MTEETDKQRNGPPEVIDDLVHLKAASNAQCAHRHENADNGDEERIDNGLMPFNGYMDFLRENVETLFELEHWTQAENLLSIRRGRCAQFLFFGGILRRDSDQSKQWKRRS